MRHEPRVSISFIRSLPETKLDIFVPYSDRRSDRNFRVHQEKPWLLEIWEPLDVKAPSPSLAQPYCCYLDTVIFYVRPYTVRPWHHYWDCKGKRLAEKPGGSFEEWGRAQHHLRWDTRFTYNGTPFECGGGQVVWIGKRWWMRHWARRRQEA